MVSHMGALLGRKEGRDGRANHCAAVDDEVEGLIIVATFGMISSAPVDLR